MKTIKGDNFITRYDSDTQLLYGIYGAEANGETTARIYMALIRLMRQANLSEITGIILDLRRVDSFSRDNLAAMQRESFRFNQKNDLSQIPLAFVVNTDMQEQIANLVIQMTPDKDRSEITFSTAEARAYFDDWHQHTVART